MKLVTMVKYSALLSVFSSALCQAQQAPAPTENANTKPALTPPTAALSGTGTADYVPLWLSGSKLGNSTIFQSAGAIGIGTITPASNLDVHGTINASSGYKLGGYSFVNGSALKGNTFLGYDVGNSTMTGGSNTAVGYVMFPDNTTGTFNTAIGEAAMNVSTTGSDNTALGAGALEANTEGYSNTATGWAALLNNTTGFGNAAHGNAALYFNTTGSYNTASGISALELNTTGSYNTGSGLYALVWNKTGSNNTAVGTGAGPDSASPDLSNATAIGANAVVSQSNSLVLGAPGVKVGIGTATPSNVFTIAKGEGQAVADGWSTYSSRRWKTNIQTLHGSLAKVEQLRGVSYDLQANGKHEVGVIAEEVGAVVPEVVTWDKNGTDAQSVDYSRLTALLIEAVKDQQAQIAQLTSQVKAMQATIERNKQSGEAATVAADLAIVRR